MAATGVNTWVKSGTSYTVPANKKFVGGGWPLTGSAQNVAVNGVTVIATSGAQFKPIVLNAGDVISTGDASGFGLIGQNYDV